MTSRWSGNEPALLPRTDFSERVLSLAGHWPSSFLSSFLTSPRKIKRQKKRTRPNFSHSDWTSLDNKVFIIWPKRELLLVGPTKELTSGQDGPILLALVANQNAWLASSCPLADSAIQKKTVYRCILKHSQSYREFFFTLEHLRDVIFSL